MKIIYLIILFIISPPLSLYSQTEHEASKNFNRLKDALNKSNTISDLSYRIDSIRTTFKDQTNNRIILSFDRSVDFNINHKRMVILFELWQYQIDLLTKNDTLYLKVLNTEYFSQLKFEYLDNKILNDYVEKRNKFYSSKKNIKNLVSEITNTDFYAIRCGESQEFTKLGKKIYRYSKKLRFNKLKKLLGNFYCENQSFGVAGFEMIKERQKKIPEKYELLVEHLKNRNSEVTTCAGSLVGLIEKIY